MLYGFEIASAPNQQHKSNQATNGTGKKPDIFQNCNVPIYQICQSHICLEDLPRVLVAFTHVAWYLADEL